MRLRLDENRGRRATAAVAALVLLTGCASYGHSAAPTGPPTTTSAAEYAKVLGSICHDTRTSLDAIKKPVEGNVTQIRGYVEQVIDLANVELAQMYTLDPPPAEHVKLEPALIRAQATFEHMKADLLPGLSTEPLPAVELAQGRVMLDFDQVFTPFLGAEAPTSCRFT